MKVLSKKSKFYKRLFFAVLLNAIIFSPARAQQLQLTYSYGVDKVWILNVGDLKPNEYPMDFFLNMAWNPTSFNENNLDEYAVKFYEEQFGEAEAGEAAEILSAYCKYNSRVTAEMLDKQTYNLEGGEFLQVKDAYMALETRALRQYMGLPDAVRDAYKELILHPVRAMANVYDLYYSVAMNAKLAGEKDLKANYWADHAEYCYKRDAELSKDYNLNIADGKWNHIMDQTHIGYRSWDEPRGGNVMPKVIRVKPEETKTGGYVFREKNGVVVMEAEHFFKSKANDKTRWTIIPDLGRTLSGVGLMPYTEKTDGGAVLYRMSLDTKSDSIKVRMFFDSTLPFKKEGQNVAAFFDGGVEKTWNINNELTWKNNYSKMFPAGAARMIETVSTLNLPKSEDGIHVLTIRPLDPGVVIYKVIVDNGGYEQTYFMFFSTWTHGYEVGLLRSKSPLGPWELASREPIFGTRKKGYRSELATGGGYAFLKFQEIRILIAKPGIMLCSKVRTGSCGAPVIT